MDILYNQLLERLENNIAELAWIDLDTGQFEAFEDNYPVQFPAVLIGLPNTDWKNVGQSVQLGDCTITFRVGFKIYEDFHNHAPDRQAATYRLKLVNYIHRYLQGFEGDHFNGLDRRNTQVGIIYNEKPLIQVFSLTYMTNIRDAWAYPEYENQLIEPDDLVFTINNISEF